MSTVQKNDVARSVPFDNSTNGFAATEVQSAIEEVSASSFAASKAFTFASYNGNANSGRYLEFFNGIDSSVAPIRVIGALNVVTIVARSTSTSTCTIEYYDIAPVTPTLLYTQTFTAASEVVSIGSTSVPLFTVPANGKLAIKIGSGSITKPHLYLTGQGG